MAERELNERRFDIHCRRHGRLRPYLHETIVRDCERLTRIL